MKTLKDFLSPQTVREQDELEVSDLPAFVIEEKDKVAKPHPMDPPAVLVMRRKAIRLYPHNQRVALYHIDKLNKYVTIPYSIVESTENNYSDYIEESIVHHLNDIVSNQVAKSIKFKDGKSMKVDVETANAVLNVHEALNHENKKKIEEMAHKSKDHFTRVVDFAWKHTKFK